MKRGVYEAGGFPVEFPVMSLGETTLRPTAMLFRNLASMDVEESIRANPIDGVVLLVGCDKTTPALLMGAASCDLPTIVVSGGPMLNGKFRGRDVGSGTIVWQFSEDGQGGRDDARTISSSAEAGMSRSAGHCMTMGTASTMAAWSKRSASACRSNAAYPGGRFAPQARSRTWSAAASSRWCKEDLRISKMLTREAFENAIRVNGAIGGSTNAVVHLLAIAGRLGVDLTLDDWDQLRPRRADHRRPDAVRPLPDGGFLLCRRLARR